MATEAVLLDRDGVINRERSDYVKTWEEFEFLPGSLAALARLAQLSCPILIISNQSAIGRGLLTLDSLERIHAKLQLTVQDHDGRIDGYYERSCGCR